ncbi:hypothetical protein HK096_002952 [Nowakowskiella sp. JEL0078]|nr:hypothetical protein HK096_002952 [Nowakowskiella sp. JEL0078]
MGKKSKRKSENEKYFKMSELSDSAQLCSIFSPPLDSDIIDGVLNDQDGNVSSTFHILNKLLAETAEGTQVSETFLKKLLDPRWEMHGNSTSVTKNYKTNKHPEVNPQNNESPDAKFLLECFPEISTEKLLQSWHDCGWNLDATILNLSKPQYDDDFSDDDSYSTTSSSTSFTSKSSFISSSSSRGSSTGNSQTKQVQSPLIPNNSIQQVVPSNIHFSPKSPRTRSNISNRLQSNVQPSKPAATISSTQFTTASENSTIHPPRVNLDRESMKVIAQIRSMFPDRPANQVDAAVIAAKGRLDDAIDVLLTGSLPIRAPETPKEGLRPAVSWAERASGRAGYQEDQLIMQVSKLFPEIKLEKIDRVLTDNRDDVFLAVQFLLNENSQKEGKLMPQFTYNSMRTDSPSWNVPKQHDPEQKSRIHPKFESKHYDLEYSRNMAAQIAQKRGEMFGKAAILYKQKGLTGHGAAVSVKNI